MLRLGRSDDAPRAVVLVGLVGAVLLCWLLLMPPGSHPDEPGHLVRAAALVRGADGDGTYLLPDRYRIAEPACYAFTPTQPASCSPVPAPTGDDVELFTRADDYPPGAHLLFGLAALLPALPPVWWARLAAAGVSAALVGAALAAALDRSRLTAAALLLGITPMAWSIMTAVNPSALATAGAAALWLGILRCTERGDARFGWLLVAGWAALVVARRDGLVWAALIVGLVTLANGASLVDLGRRLGRWRLAVAGAATLVTLIWGATSPSTTSRLVLAAPTALVAAEAAGRWWPRRTRPERLAAAAGLAIVATVVGLLVVAARPGGWDTNLTLSVVAQTDDNLVEAFGVLGWLDTSVPYVTLYAWLLALGVLAGVAVLTDAWRAAAGLVLVTVVTSWTFELLQGNSTGTYWQGRYSLPLLLGLPLLLVGRADELGERVHRLDAPVTLLALLFTNVAAWAAARRFGVGVVGSHLPWHWDTPLQPVPPIVLLAALAAASLALAATVVGPLTARR